MKSTMILLTKSKSGCERWNADYNDERIVDGARDPEHAACRVLQARGISGRVQFFHAATGTIGLSMHIATGAGLTVNESDTKGLRVRKYEPFSSRVESPARSFRSGGTMVLETIGGAP